MAAYTRNQRRQKLMAQQRVMGLIMLLITGLIFWLASTGVTPEDQDCTAIFITIPLGLWFLFSRKIVIV